MPSVPDRALDPGTARIEAAAPPVTTRLAPALAPRIPSLDGLRAVSILLVILAHAVGTRNFYGVPSLEHIGNLGVKVFFVISGMLITTLLLREYDKSGGISLRAFYMRRALRIFPAFYFYWAMVAVLWSFGLFFLYPGDLLHAATYTENYVPGAWQVNHIWSLSVEEQFYLLWPATLVLLGPARSVFVPIGAIVLAPVVRTAMWYWAKATPTAMTREFQAICDLLAMGCLLALAYNWLGHRRWYVRFQASRAFLAAPLMLLGLSAATYFVGLGAFYSIGQTVANLGIGLLVDHFVRFPSGPLGTLLNSRPFVAVGTISYSLYLWQQFFMDAGSRRLVASFPLNVILTFAVATASYFLIEKPALRLKAVLETSRERRSVRHSAQR